MSNEYDKTQILKDTNGETFAHINPETIEYNTSNIGFIGKNVSDLYEVINHNFVNIMQNFYGEQAPINPLEGQNWFSSKDKMMFRWLNTNWTQQEPDNVYDTFLFVYKDLEKNEVNLNESVFNLTINNIKLYDQDMNDVAFIIDTFDSKKIILRQSGVQDLYVFVFHPKDKIVNPNINTKQEFLTGSGQTQYDVSDIINGTNLNTLSVTLNDVMLKNNEFSVKNDTLTIDGKIYRVKKNDVLTVYKHGGSQQPYYSDVTIKFNKMTDTIVLPKFFKDLVGLKINDLDELISVNQIETQVFKDSYKFLLLKKRNIKAKAKIRLI